VEIQALLFDLGKVLIDLTSLWASIGWHPAAICRVTVLKA